MSLHIFEGGHPVVYRQLFIVLVQLGYIWRHVSAVNRPSSGQQRIVLLRYSQIVQWDNII